MDSLSNVATVTVGSDGSLLMENLETPTPSGGRLEFVDSLRGFALFGVFWANLLIFSGIAYMNDEQRNSLLTSRLDWIAYYLERFLIENKFIGLFSFLFGISFWLFLSRARSRGGPATSLFYRRIFWLFVIGLAHGWLLWCFDVLRFYALWAILLPLFVRTAPRRLLLIALTASILVPALVSGTRALVSAPTEATTNFDAMALAAFSSGTYREVLIANWRYDWYLTESIGQIAYQVAVFGRLLLGLYVARTIDFGNLDSHRVLLRRVVVGGAIAGVIGTTIFAGNLISSPNAPFIAFIRRFLIETGHIGLTLFYASGLALAFLIPRLKTVISLLAPVGRMALTWYLLQTVFGIWLFYGFAHGPALMGKVSPAYLLALGVVGFWVQVVCATVWLRRFRFGPGEWLWRTLTYWKAQPFRMLVPILESGKKGQ
jgi:uncharacterized protein